MPGMSCISMQLCKLLPRYIGSAILLLHCAQSLAVIQTPYTAYIGGELNDSTYDSSIDTQGNVVIVGQTHSASITGINSVFSSTTVDQNCFVTRINPESPQQNLAIIIGGNASEVCRKVLIDPSNNIYIIGETQSSDFPVTNNTQLRGNWDGFLIKLDNQLNLQFATYIGGSNTDFAHGLAFYDKDKIAIVGETWSQDFPTTSNAYIENCLTLDVCDSVHANAYLYVIQPQENAIPIYSSYLGGVGNDKAHSVSSSGNRIAISGETQSADFPLIQQLSNSLKGSLDAFVSLFEFTTDSQVNLLFSSYLGGNGDDSGMQIKFDSNGNLVVTGESSSDDFPTTNNAFSKRCASGASYCLSGTTARTDIFITQLDTQLYKLKYSSLFGGSHDDTPFSLLITADNKLWISGNTYSEDFPITDNAEKKHCTTNKTCAKDADGFFIKLDPELPGQNSLLYASYFGGDQNDSISKLHIKNDLLYLTGDTDSGFVSTTGNVNSQPQNGDAFISIEILPAAGKLLNTPHEIKNDMVRSSSLSLTNLLWIFLFLWIFRQRYKLSFLPGINRAYET